MFEQPSEEEQEKYKQFFLEADVNGDGELSFEELLNTFRTQGYPLNHAKTFVKTIFTRCGADPQGGTISFDAYAKAFKVQVNPKLQEYRRVFDEMDTDGNGTLNIDEIEEVFIKLGIFVSDRELKRLFAIVDKDKSGAITFTEFVQHVCHDTMH